jgi:hypothetical protein
LGRPAQSRGDLLVGREVWPGPRAFSVNLAAYMASLPLDANVLFMTVMASKMPFVGRG